MSDTLIATVMIGFSFLFLSLVLGLFAIRDAIRELIKMMEDHV